MPEQERKYPHFVLEGFTETERFRSPSQGGGSKMVPDRDREIHGDGLLRQVATLKRTMGIARQAQVDAGLEAGFGLQVEFESFPDIELAFDSLARERSGIELLNVRHDGNMTRATVFVPDGKLSHVEN